MTDQQTYELLGHTVKIAPAVEYPWRMCRGCVFQGENKCPSVDEELSAGIAVSCGVGGHKYVEVQPA